MYHRIGLEVLLALVAVCWLSLSGEYFTFFDAADACAAAEVEGDQVCFRGSLLQVAGDGVEDE